MLSPLEQALLALALGLLMLGMGTSLAPADLAAVRRRPLPLLLGLASQFGWMPLLAFTLVQLLDVPPALGLALILVGCTPGGSTSNLYTFLARGDLALSIGMTVASTVTALAMTPLLLWLYAGTSASIPLSRVAATLGFVLIPVAAGMALRALRPSWAARMQRLTSVVGVLTAVLLLLVWGPSFASQVVRGHAATYSAILCLMATGFGAGYLTARLTGSDHARALTICFETGLQNTPLTFAIITLSFPAAQAETMGWVPLVYGPLAMCVGTVIALTERVRLRKPWRSAHAKVSPQGGRAAA